MEVHPMDKLSLEDNPISFTAKALIWAIFIILSLIVIGAFVVTSPTSQ